MRLLFSGRYAKLETMNRILTDAARKRTERIGELETQLTQLERQVAHLKQELEPARKRARELEVVAAQRADLINEKEKELALAREELIKRADLLNEKEKELAVAREELTKRADLLNEKDKELAVVRDKLTETSLRIQELEVAPQHQLKDRQ
jgi:chromosome segregation ATPase